MGIRLMTLAWNSKFCSAIKVVLLALVENADDDGTCYPSIANKCSMRERGWRSFQAEWANEQKTAMRTLLAGAT